MSRWKAVLLVVIAAPFVHFFATEAGKQTANSVNRETQSQPNRVNSEEEVRVRVDISAANGITQDDMDMEFLRQFERAMAQEMKAAIEKSMADSGYPNQDLDVSSSAQYTYAESTKLLILRLQIGPVNQTLVTGIVGDEQRLVTCVAASQESIPITHGKCGDAIKETFGAGIGV